MYVPVDVQTRSLKSKNCRGRGDESSPPFMYVEVDFPPFPRFPPFPLRDQRKRQQTCGFSTFSTFLRAQFFVIRTTRPTRDWSRKNWEGERPREPNSAHAHQPNASSAYAAPNAHVVPPSGGSDPFRPTTNPSMNPSELPSDTRQTPVPDPSEDPSNPTPIKGFAPRNAYGADLVEPILSFP